MQYINIGLIFIAGLNVGLAFLIWLRNPKNKINIWFAVSVILVGIWSFAVGMFREAEDFIQAWIWTWIQFGAGVLTVIPFFFFSIYFPYQKWKLKKWHKLLITLSVLVIIWVVLMPGVWIKEIYFTGSDIEYLVTNRWGLAYANLHVLIYLLMTFYNFISKYKESSGFFKKQLFYVIVATGIISVLGFIFGTFIPMILAEKGPHWVGPYASLPMIVFLTYFIFKKE